jgi:hypothetical protein
MFLNLRLLPAAGLVDGEMEDRWANRTALKELMRTRNKSFKVISAKARCNSNLIVGAFV